MNTCCGPHPVTGELSCGTPEVEVVAEIEECTTDCGEPGGGGPLPPPDDTDDPWLPPLITEAAAYAPPANLVKTLTTPMGNKFALWVLLTTGLITVLGRRRLKTAWVLKAELLI